MNEATVKLVLPMTKVQLAVLREWSEAELKQGRCIRLHPSWVIGLLDHIGDVNKKIESGGDETWEQHQVEKAEDGNG